MDKLQRDDRGMIKNVYYQIAEALEQFGPSQILPLIGLIVMPIVPVVVGLFIFISLDCFVGVWASIKKFGWENITSRRLADSAIKFVIYFIVVLVAMMVKLLMYYIVDLGGYGEAWVDWFPVVTATAGFLVLVELKSIYENASIILGMDLWNGVMNFMKSIKTKGLEESNAKDHKNEH